MNPTEAPVQPDSTSHADPVIPSASPTPTHDELLRHAFLLQQLARAPGGKLSRGQANRKITKPIKRELGLDGPTADRCCEQLAAQGYLTIERKGRSITYVVTDQGKAHLANLPVDAVPLGMPRGKINPPSNDDVRREREAFLLLALLKSPRHTQTLKEANRGLKKDRLELNAATATHVRHELAERGFLTVHRHGRSVSYTLTAAGRLHLGGLEFYETSHFQLTGRVLNELLEAARETAKQFETPQVKPAPTAGELGDWVLAEFNELRREKHQLSGMVPIHEIRSGIRHRHGDATARHDVFDEVLLRVHREGRVRLSSISDHARATPEQLQDSIPGVGQTLFYAEVAHEPALS